MSRPVLMKMRSRGRSVLGAALFVLLLHDIHDRFRASFVDIRLGIYA